MSTRKQPLINNQIYHVFNRGLDGRPTFPTNSFYRRALQALNFYQYHHPTLRLATYLQKNPEDRQIYDLTLATLGRVVDVLAFCLMPNHFHLLVMQRRDGGISEYLKQFQGSYTKYYNARHDRSGSLFQRQFKAVHIESDSQLQHVSRYIHLNPYSAGISKEPQGIAVYPWSSMEAYVNGSPLTNFPDLSISSVLAGYQTADGYPNFVFDQADYQKTLESIKHLQLDD